LAPRFSPSQRAWVLSGTRVAVSPAVPASAGRDSDDRWCARRGPGCRPGLVASDEGEAQL